MKLKLGIFDSGIGGFTVLKSLFANSSLDEMEVIYLADIARNPYGEKGYGEIREIAFEICKWFKKKNLDALLIACNTTNACALDILEKNLSIPCFDLIKSVSEDVLTKNVGVLATSATVNSSFYKRTFNDEKEINVIEQACPEFVKEIERIPIDYSNLNLLADLYLQPLLKENIEEIVLGCSHYPLIVDILRNKIPPNIKILDPSKSLVRKLDIYFKSMKNESNKFEPLRNVEFFVTENIEEFSLKVKNWLEINKEISLVNLRTHT